MATNLAAAILGLVGVRSSFSRGVNLATVVCGIGSIITMFTAAMILIAGLMGTSDVADVISPLTPSMFVFDFFRFCALFVAYLALLAFGMMELFSTSGLALAAHSNQSR